jgi:hypothetical protein
MYCPCATGRSDQRRSSVSYRDFNIKMWFTIICHLTSMLQYSVPPTPNAIDGGGDTIPTRPSRRNNKDDAPLFHGDVRRNAERLLDSIERIASFRESKRGRGDALTRSHQVTEDIDLTQASLPISIHDAQDRTDEDIDLEQHQKRRPDQVLFGIK